MGYTAVIVASGDSFKNYAVDFSVAPRFFNKYYLPRKFKNAVYRFSKIDLAAIETGIRFYFLLPKLKGYTHMQLINSNAVETYPFLAKLLYKKLLKQNGKMSLLVCGDETPVIDYLLKKELPNNVLTPYLENPGLKDLYSYSLKYITKRYRELFQFVKEHSSVIVTSDLDYKIPMERMGYTVQHIPNPVNTDRISFKKPVINDTIVIFLGINRFSAIRKGIVFFEKALKKIEAEYPERTEIIIAENLPYAEYLHAYKRAHILLDYTYALDQGYNALEAMAAGKVVFTGAGEEFMQHYNLTERVAIHAEPDPDAIAAELEYLINNPDEIKAIGSRARDFILKEHYYIKVAQMYLKAWKLK